MVATRQVGGKEDIEGQELLWRSNNEEGVSDGEAGGETPRSLEEGEPLAELVRDVTLGRAVLAQVLAGTWWDWTNGSSLIFWRWNGRAQIKAARDGMDIFVHRPLPRGRRLKPLNLEADQKRLVVS